MHQVHLEAIVDGEVREISYKVLNPLEILLKEFNHKVDAITAEAVTKLEGVQEILQEARDNYKEQFNLYDSAEVLLVTAYLDAVADVEHYNQPHYIFYGYHPPFDLVELAQERQRATRDHQPPDYMDFVPEQLFRDVRRQERLSDAL